MAEKYWNFHTVDSKVLFFLGHNVTDTQCGQFENLQPFRFYVKSISENQKCIEN